MNWQPIETAPKTGEDILIWGIGTGTIRGNWDSNQYAAKPRPYWTNDRETVFGTIWARKNQPTHWMPLPEAPLAEMKGGVRGYDSAKYEN